MVQAHTRRRLSVLCKLGNQPKVTELDIDIKIAIEAAERMAVMLRQSVVITPELRIVPFDGYCGEYLERVKYI